MTSGFRNASGVDFDLVFDLYVSGTKPAATGYRTSDGVDLNQRYAPLALGSAAAATGFRVASGPDVNTLWAAKGTSHTSLPIDGQTYQQNYTIPSGNTGYSQVSFLCNTGSTWQVYGSSPTVPSNVLASGSIPAGAATCSASFGAVTTPSGYVSAGGATSTNMSAHTAVGSSPYARLTSATVGASSGSRQSSVQVTIVFYNSAGTAISTSTCTFIVDTEGSV